MPADASVTFTNLSECLIDWRLGADGGRVRAMVEPRRSGSLEIPVKTPDLTGKTLDGKRALKAGLVDDILPKEDFVSRATGWLRARLDAAAHGRVLAARAAARRKASAPLPPWVLEGNPLGRAFVFGQRDTRGELGLRRH